MWLPKGASLLPNGWCISWGGCALASVVVSLVVHCLAFWQGSMGFWLMQDHLLPPPVPSFRLIYLQEYMVSLEDSSKFGKMEYIWH